MLSIASYRRQSSRTHRPSCIGWIRAQNKQDRISRFNDFNYILGEEGGKAANWIKKRIDFTRFEHWLGKRTRARITSPVRGYRSGVWILVIRIAFRSNRSASRLRSTQPFLYRAKEISTFSSRSSPLYNNYKMTRDDLRLDCDQSFYTVAYTW